MYYYLVMKKLRMSLLLLLFFLVASQVWAVIDPSWYAVSFTQDSWLSSNTHNLTWGGQSLYIGRINMEREDNPAPPANLYDPNLVIKITMPNDLVQLTNVSDPSKVFPCYISMTFGKNKKSVTYNVTESPYEIPVEVVWYAGSNITLTVPPMSGSDEGYEGTYTTYFRIQVFTSDMQLVAEDIMVLIVYYISPSGTPGEPVFTNLFLQPYPAADNVDIPLMQSNATSLTVGEVTFMSNDSSNDSSYALIISPSVNPEIGFAFYRGSGTGPPVKYKVHIPGRTTPSALTFTSPVPDKALTGYWQDQIELAISNMNYNNAALAAGSYSSTIQVNLISD
jgi:hypothetical protein